MSLILGIETSCDETAVAIYDENRGLLSHIVYSQIKLHKKYGGVVPELASRDHVAKLNCVVRSALDDANCSLKDLSAIAYTAGPGLAGALMVGAGFATSLAMSLNIAALPVHHLEAHISVSLLDTEQISYPFLALLVSGGHTQIILAHEFGKYEIIGETLDDAVGEAFDKSAKIMGLPYPGGREIERLALAGDPSKYDFPRPMLKRKGCDFSFSGLKTAVANTWFNSSQTKKVKADIAASFQVAVVESCCDRVLNAFSLSNSRDFVVAGG
ncbi:MAG: tRNA (adenosine(37)-N6)-threonylcarbamoyltransferase complex transferase subunit TsaD, partial [Pseudomonadota bacterium]|nr:tRNA (adenosine(37)-N6)-threonylcarbamoyltransferase complex transferase subunit TsaD [Pseudomonadota bacterium]